LTAFARVAIGSVPIQECESGELLWRRSATAYLGGQDRRDQFGTEIALFFVEVKSTRITHKGGSKMKRSLILLSSAAMALSFATAQSAHAGTPPNAAVQGAWALGSYVSDSDGVSTATLIFDGNGGVTGTLSANADGTYCAGMGVSGSYVVNPGNLSSPWCKWSSLRFAAAVNR
jgi:hypothetical protein